MATVACPSERLVILDRVSWETYERLLTEHGERNGTRFTYDGGVLEIMVVSSRHEMPNRTLAALVEVLAEEWSFDIARLGSTTIKREDLQKGFEPDSCFYIQRADEIRGKEDLDFGEDPAPDLTIEVDIPRESLNRFPIFAAVGIPEVWRFDGTRVSFFQLDSGRYVENEHSLAFPALRCEVATEFLNKSQKLKSTVWLREVRDWARAQKHLGL